MPTVRAATRTRRATAVALLVLVAGCTREPERMRESVLVFGGEATIELHSVPPEQGQAALTEVTEQLSALHGDWHAWEPGALTELNAAFARGERNQPPPSLRDLILRSQPLSIRSDGVFEPAVGALMKLWGFHTSDYPIVTPLPTRAQTWARPEACRAPTARSITTTSSRSSARSSPAARDAAGAMPGV